MYYNPLLISSFVKSPGCRFDEAVSMLLFACSVYISSTLFSLLGVALMRMDRLAEAEDALVEANLLDYRNPEVWAYLSLLCLTSGPFRMEESTKCLFQALRLGLNSSSLLRELATANMAADKLQTAEDLVRTTRKALFCCYHPFPVYSFHLECILSLRYQHIT